MNLFNYYCINTANNNSIFIIKIFFFSKKINKTLNIFFNFSKILYPPNKIIMNYLI